MSTNNYKPHVLILPEDDANKDIANGFCLEGVVKQPRQVQVLPSAGGWAAVRDSFETAHNAAMARWKDRRMVLLVDFDGEPARLEDVLARVEASLRDRVFVLGAFDEPESLRKDLGPFERIGRALAKDCAANTSRTWDHPLLRHNAPEIARMIPAVRSILF